MLRAQNKKEKEDKAEAEHAASKAAWELERAAAARARTARRAEAAEAISAVDEIPLPVGVEPLDHNRRTTRSVSKQQAHAVLAANEREQASRGVPLASGDGVWVTIAAANRELPNSRDEIPIPKHSGEASSSPLWKSWRAAMDSDI